MENKMNKEKVSIKVYQSFNKTKSIYLNNYRIYGMEKQLYDKPIVIGLVSVQDILDAIK